MTDAPPPPPSYSPAVATAPRGLSLTSFILGIASIVLSAAWIGFFAGIAGLILAILARRREPGAPAWMKTLGLVLSIVGLVLSLIITIVYIVSFLALAALSSGSNLYGG